MKILSADQIKALDAHTIEHEPIPSISLMERASTTFVKWFIELFNPDREVWIFCGPGNNGGDGLAVARLLFQIQYKVKVFIFSSHKYSKDFDVNLQRLEKLMDVKQIENLSNLPIINASAIVIDSIFGSGLSRTIEGVYADIINSINNSKATVISIDIASGLFCDSHNEDYVKIKPDYTFTFQVPKLSFFLPQNEVYTGELVVRDIGLDQAFLDSLNTPFSYLEYADILPLIKPRKKFAHKGDYGKALIMAGSFGMIGAAVLCGKSCYRSGAGLVKFHTPKCGVTILQVALPEAILSVDSEDNFISSLPDLDNYRAIAAGPGWYEGPEAETVLTNLLSSAQSPIVLDAGALNILSRNKKILELLPPNTILTPHPGEFKRLAGDFPDDYKRLEGLKNFAIRYNCIVVLKGANTAIAQPEGMISFNSTGNPGMATAGSGDVLTGIITGLLAQGYSPSDAAKLGVFMHGYAGDRAAEKCGAAAMIAEDIIDGIKSFYLNIEQL